MAIMKAVAAQMKRIMERMKLVVNSFEEVCRWPCGMGICTGVDGLWVIVSS